MTKILYINSNPKAVDQSFGLQLGQHFLEEWLKNEPDAEVETVNLYKEDIPLIDEVVLSAWGKFAVQAELTAEEAAKVGRMNEILEQFLAADVYVFATPMWNLSYPPLLKAYIDNITIAGKTFKYTENGPQGLLKDKTVVHVQARGGIYSEGPAAQLEFTNNYLQSIMQFIGITDYHHLFVEGMAATPDRAEEILAAAKEKASELAAQLTTSAQLA
ncbi:FMN-dependent NADH-azoreductase [Fictibacillus sp. Mic-4]|uniref:FMN-dependent NADH-azoreductase n=1 Tax=Fictibacillus sp. Mic-4 TaxID=3132826 RepID=UPI003CE7AAC3